MKRIITLLVAAAVATAMLSAPVRAEMAQQSTADKVKTMTAVDNLQSYSAIVEAHAEGLKKFVPAFEALYASMSDAQKKNADTIFRSRSHMRAKRH